MGLLRRLTRLSRSEQIALVKMLKPVDGKQQALQALVSLDEESATKGELTQILVHTLVHITGIQEDPPSTWEASLARNLANILGVDYESSMTHDQVFDACREKIADGLASEILPFIEVSVCMGWADGRLSTEEIEVMDAALSQLRILRKKRNELLSTCSRPLVPSKLAEELTALASDRNKSWILLSLGWSVALADDVTHTGEIRTHQELASYLGFSSPEAALVRKSVEKRFKELRADSSDQSSKYPSRNFNGKTSTAGPSAGPRDGPRDGWKDAAMAAVSASGLDHYLHAATGLKTMNLFLNPFQFSSVKNTRGQKETPRISRARSEWILAPALVAGALFLADRAENENQRRLLVTAVYLSEIT